MQILDDLRKGLFDVLIGVNLLREGLDLPQVSLVAILDADKEGFLRDHRSLTQTAGRAARNVNCKVIMYADSITRSMKLTIDETNRRREKQLKYNQEHNITPKPVMSGLDSPLAHITPNKAEPKAYVEKEFNSIAAEPVIKTMNYTDLEKAIKNAKHHMEEAAKKMDFMEAAQWRDEMIRLEAVLNEKNK